VSAANEYEKMFSIVVMVIGAIFYAVVLGSVTAAIQSISSSSEPFLEHMRCIEKFIKRHNLCDELADRLRQTTAFQWQQLESANIEQVCTHFNRAVCSGRHLTDLLATLQGAPCVYTHYTHYTQCTHCTHTILTILTIHCKVMGHFHPELQSEILLTIHRPMLIKSSFFQKVEEGFVKVV
jgi:hypothetical protein